jgi:hypothetical protein
MSLKARVKSLILSATLFVVAGLLLVGTSPAAIGQSSTGTLTGTVADPQGAVIPGASVKVVDPTTNSVREASTNEVGRFTINSIPPGDYVITVTKEGFTAARLSGQHVEVGETLTLNVPLAVGAATTVVEVQAAAGAELQTLNATIGTTMRNDTLNLLPNLSRDVTTLASLQVGVSLAGNVAGAAVDQNKMQLDGGNNTDDMAGGGNSYVPGGGVVSTAATGGTPSGVMPTPVESIEEFKVGTMGQTADFGTAAGSQIQMVTKRGTNQYHGAAYENYFANNVGAANLWLNNHTPSGFYGTPDTPLPKSHRNRYGGAFGGTLLPKFWGGKTYFFANYEANRFPINTTLERGSPTALYRAGVIILPNTAGVNTPYNINPFAVTVNGTTYQPCAATSSCDPRGLGINPTVQALWNKMPLPNDPSYTAGRPGDGYGNSGGFLAPISLPQNSDFIVGRIDHDFGAKNRLMVSYRDYDFHLLVNSQTDMSGILAGSPGSYTSTAPRAIKPSYWVVGLTTIITPNMTNDFHISYLRNFWQWFTAAGPPQLPGLGGALNIGGESSNALIPYNVDSQDVRQRFWDGKDLFLSDQLSHLHGNHVFQYGGTYQRNHDLHARNDNGVTIDTSITYEIGQSGTGIPTAIPSSAFTLPPGVSSGALTNYENLFAQATGMISTTQLMYTRSGSALNLNPPFQFAQDDSIIPTYGVYWTDTWHVKPHLTLSYGVSWDLALPPYELNGKQVEMVDQAGNAIGIKAFMKNRMDAALQGQAYQPQIGFALIGNANGGQDKYPYRPFYGGFSPHVSLAWNPNFNDGIMKTIFGSNNTVIRGGYGRIYGRLNGVDLMLVPLLGPGLLQGVQCVAPLTNGTCAGTNGATPLTAFRIGVDGNSPPVPSATATLPQPFFPGIMQNGTLNPGTADGSQLDPNLRPNHSDEVTFSVQRSFGTKFMLEVGYIGRKINNEFQEISIDPVPWMMTTGGQSFAQAYANVYGQYCGLQGTTASGVTCNKNMGAVTNQPFFEAALGGPSSAYCAAAGSCTKAVIAAEAGNFQTTSVNTLWINLNKASSWQLGRTMAELPVGPGLNQQLTGAFDFISSYGHGSYNAAFAIFRTTNWHGLTTQSNFTWGRALGTGSVTQASSSISVPNPYDFKNFGTYGPQPFDVKYTYSLLMVYQEPWFKSQKGLLGRVLGGWTLSPLFTARSGLPLRVTNLGGSAQSFGEVYSGQSANYENAVPAAPYTGGSSATGFYNQTVPTGTSVASAENPAGTSHGSGINLFNNPAAVAAEFRPLVLGVDTSTTFPLRGFPFWNLDATLSKDIRVREGIGLSILIQSVNVLNHFVPADPSASLASPASFGVVTNQFTSGNGVASRWMEFGLKLRF